MVNRIRKELAAMEENGAPRPIQVDRIEGTPEDQLEQALATLERSARMGLVGSTGPAAAKNMIRHLFAVKQPAPMAEGMFSLRGTLFGVEFEARGALTHEEAQQAGHVRRMLEKLAGAMTSAIGDFARNVRDVMAREAEQRHNPNPEGIHGHEEGNEEGSREEERHHAAEEPEQGDQLGEGHRPDADPRRDG